MPEQMPEIVPVDICVEQLIVADFALRQAFSRHHPTPHRSHVLTVPVIHQCDGMILACASSGIYVLLEILRGLTAGAAHPPLGLRRQIGMCPWSHAQAGGLIAWDLHTLWLEPVQDDDRGDLDRASSRNLPPSCAGCCHPD